MDLLQKLTFYDLLGYVLPGSVLIGLWQWNESGHNLALDKSSAFWAVYIILSYLVGIMISEVAERLGRVTHTVPALGKKDSLQEICKTYGITLSQLTERLKKAKMLEEDKNITKFEELEQHARWIYSIVQRDPQSRIHNYASAALLYKNIMLVAVFCFAFGFYYRTWQEIVAGFISFVIFGLRYHKFHRKKLGYSLCWFLSKQEA